MVYLSLALALAAGLGVAAAQSPESVSSPGVTQTPGINLTPQDRGDIFMARKMYREAIEAYAKGSKDDAILWNKIGIGYHQLGQLDKAKQSYQRALKLNPRYAEAQNNVGTVYYAQRSYRRAISSYRRALQIQPRSASFHMNLGMAFLRRKMDKECQEEYQIALQIDPGAFENHGTFGPVLEDRNVDSEDRARFHYALAKTCAKASLNDQALQYLKKAFEEGFKDKKKLEQDPEFGAMRDLPEFKALLAAEPRVL